MVYKETCAENSETRPQQKYAAKTTGGETLNRISCVEMY